MVVYKPLFAYAEMLEYIPEHLICFDSTAHYFAQVVKAFAEILADKVAWEAGSQAVLHTVDSVEGMGQSFVVAYVAYNHIGLRKVG